MTTYRTIVLHVPPTPMGLLPERWAVDHWCNACHQRVGSDQLVAHAKGHESIDIDVPGESFPPAWSPGRMTPDAIELNSNGEVSRG